LKQATIKFKICPKEITTADATALYASLPSLPDLTAQNAHGRFVVAPPAMWPDDACPDSAGFMGKITKSVTVRGQGVVLTIKFKDKTQHMSLSAVQPDRGGSASRDFAACFVPYREGFTEPPDTAP
jgi:hypothetical protein